MATHDPIYCFELNGNGCPYCYRTPVRTQQTPGIGPPPVRTQQTPSIGPPPVRTQQTPRIGPVLDSLQLCQTPRIGLDPARPQQTLLIGPALASELPQQKVVSVSLAVPSKDTEEIDITSQPLWWLSLTKEEANAIIAEKAKKTSAAMKAREAEAEKAKDDENPFVKGLRAAADADRKMRAAVVPTEKPPAFSALHALAFALLINAEAEAQGDNGWVEWKAPPRQPKPSRQFLLKPFGEILSRNVSKDDVQPVGLVRT
jgi:hypothetical protein